MKEYDESTKTTTYWGDNIKYEFYTLKQDLTNIFIQIIESVYSSSSVVFEFGMIFDISSIEEVILNEQGQKEWKVTISLGIIDYAVKELLSDLQIDRHQTGWLFIVLNECLTNYMPGVKITIKEINTYDCRTTLSLLENVKEIFELRSYNLILDAYESILIGYRESGRITFREPYIKHLLKKLNILKTDDNRRLILANSSKENNIKNNPPIYSQGKESEFIEWKGHYFRSYQEVEIAKELDSRQILFFPNAGCRVLEEKGMHTREIDFLIIIDGNMGILECDSERYHQSAARDHKRDGLFNAHGIWFIRRYTSQDCQDPKKVVDGFISDFEKFIRHKK